MATPNDSIKAGTQYRTADGYTLTFVDLSEGNEPGAQDHSFWTDGDLEFACGTDGLPVTDDGEKIEGDTI